jgi:hypothetical protein
MRTDPHISRRFRPSTKGFVPLPRTFFDHPIWGEKRVFTPAEALLDLLRMARCLPTEHLQRGEFQKSQFELAERWMWSRTKVRRFLEAREQEGLIEARPVLGGDIAKYRICEVAIYPESRGGQPSGQPPTSPNPLQMRLRFMWVAHRTPQKRPPPNKEKKEPKKRKLMY